MARRVTAEDRLARILYLIPVAAREGGAPLDELASALGAEPREILEDLEEVYTREYYHPAGSGDEAIVTIERERVSVRTKGELRRPSRLNRRETVALGLSLRSLAMEHENSRREELLKLAERLERSIGSAPEGELPQVLVSPAAPDSRSFHELLADAAHARRRCRIRYLKPGSAEPEEREVEPYAVIIADGRRYLVGRCLRRNGPRVFRVDRVLELEVLSDSFDPPSDFDPARFVTDGRVYLADAAQEVIIRYSPVIAPWMRERGPVEEQPDGSVHISHSVADPEWAVRHVLQYGADAEILSPAELRAAVREAMGRLLG